MCLTSYFVLFCLPFFQSLLSIYHSLSISLFVCLPVLSNLGVVLGWCGWKMGGIGVVSGWFECNGLVRFGRLVV